MNRSRAIASASILPNFRLSRLGAVGSVAALACLQAAGHLLAGGHDDQRLLQTGFLLVFGLWMAASGRSSVLAGALNSRAGVAMACVFMLGLASAALSFSPRHALWEVSNLFLLTALGTCVAGEVARHKQRALSFVLHVVGATCLCYVAMVLPAYAAALATSIPPEARTFTPGFNNHRFLNHAQTVSLPLLVLLWATSASGGRLRQVWFVTAACWWALLYFTGGRGTFVGLAAGCAVSLLVLRQSASGFVKAMLVTAIAGVAVQLLFFVAIPMLAGMEPFGQMGKVAERSLSRPTSGRIELWASTLEVIRSHPLLGAGPAHFAHVGSASPVAAHPHNWILQVGSEWGLPALVLVLYVTGTGIRRLVKVRDHLAATDASGWLVLSAFFATAVAIMVDSLVSGVIVMPVSQLMVTLFAGTAAGWTLAHAAPAPHAPGTALRSGAAVVVLAAVACLAWSVLPDLAVAAGFEQRLSRPYYNPRMWQDGNF